MALNPMAIMAFLAKYPGLVDLLSRFPNFKPDTIQLLLSFLKKAVENPDPEEFLRASIQNALRPPPITVEVTSSKPSLPRRR